jgi:hypothetical protein
MSIQAEINSQLLQRNLLPLTEDQVSCLQDPHRLEEAVGMLEDLRDRCGVRLPLPQGIPLAGPLETLEDARADAEKHLRGHPVVAVDEMATDDSRSSGVGNEFYVTAFNGPDAALALVNTDDWAAYWVQGVEQESA